MNTHATVGRVGVVFDLDGTLVNSEPLWAKGFSAGLTHILAARGHGSHEVDPADMSKYQGGRVSDTVDAILGFLGLLDKITEPERGAIVGEVIDFVSREFIAHPAPIQDAVSTVQALHAQNISMAVASSSAAPFIDAALTTIGLEDCFPVRVSAFDLPHGKPDPAVYLLALHRMGLSARSVIAVEDSPVGVASAVNAGIQCVWFVPGEAQGTSLQERPDLRRALTKLVDSEYDIVSSVTLAGRISSALLMQFLSQLGQRVSDEP